MKVSVDGVEYCVNSTEEFLAVQKVLIGVFSKVLERQAKEEIKESIRTEVIEQYWEDAETNNDVQNEILEGVIGIPSIYDRIVDGAIMDTGYSSIDDLTYDLSRMKETFDDIRNLADDWI